MYLGSICAIRRDDRKRCCPWQTARNSSSGMARKSESSNIKAARSAAAIEIEVSSHKPTARRDSVSIRRLRNVKIQNRRGAPVK